MDTNVLVSALRSQQGASHKFLRLVGQEKFQICVSVPLVLEYESAAKRLIGSTPLSGKIIDDILDYLCKVAVHGQIYYLWRPFLPDPKDDMVMELAVSAGCDFIITFNKKDFKGVEKFGLKTLTPQEFLERIGGHLT